jgi:hypothetical protein
MLVDLAENPEPNETTPTPRVPVRTRAATQHSGGAASLGALAMGAVVLGALTVDTIAMPRTRILSDRAEHPEPSGTTPTPGAPGRTRAVTQHSGGAASPEALVMGAMALGAMAVGAVALGRLAIGNLALNRRAHGREWPTRACWDVAAVDLQPSYRILGCERRRSAKA